MNTWKSLTLFATSGLLIAGIGAGYAPASNAHVEPRNIIDTSESLYAKATHWEDRLGASCSQIAREYVNYKNPDDAECLRPAVNVHSGSVQSFSGNDGSTIGHPHGQLFAFTVDYAESKKRKARKDASAIALRGRLQGRVKWDCTPFGSGRAEYSLYIIHKITLTYGARTKFAGYEEVYTNRMRLRCDNGGITVDGIEAGIGRDGISFGVDGALYKTSKHMDTYRFRSMADARIAVPIRKGQTYTTKSSVAFVGRTNGNIAWNFDRLTFPRRASASVSLYS